MKFKKVAVLLVGFVILIGGESAQARDMGLYVNNQYLVRDVQSIENFDMLPLLDIAGELGFWCTFDGTTAVLYNDTASYCFTLGSPIVYNHMGRKYGLDIVPQYINGKFMIPAKFFQDAFGKTYIWDDVTDTLFLGSDSAYQWLIGTKEYQQEKSIKQTWNAVQGWWFCEPDPIDPYYFSENICFYPDGTFYCRTWRIKGYGTYRVTDLNTIEVSYDVYFNFAGTTTFDYYWSNTCMFELSGGNLFGKSNYCSYGRFEHRNSFTYVPGQQ